MVTQADRKKSAGRASDSGSPDVVRHQSAGSGILNIQAQNGKTFTQPSKTPTNKQGEQLSAKVGPFSPAPNVSSKLSASGTPQQVSAKATPVRAPAQPVA